MNKEITLGKKQNDKEFSIEDIIKQKILEETDIVLKVKVEKIKLWWQQKIEELNKNEGFNATIKFTETPEQLIININGENLYIFNYGSSRVEIKGKPTGVKPHRYLEDFFSYLQTL